MTPAILHIGFGKTGSTSIQAAFATNRKLLQAHGWRYARFTQAGRETPNQSRAFINLYGAPDESYVGNLHAGKSAAQQARHYRAEMQANLDPQTPVIFSGETLSALPAKALKTLRRDLEDAAYAPRMIALVRAPGELLHSLAQQRVRNGWPDFRAERPFSYEFSGRIKRIRRAFPEAEFHPFAHAAAHPKGPAGFLADLIAPGLSADLPEQRSNPRISDQATRLIRHVNILVPVFLQSGRRQLSPMRLSQDLRPLEQLAGDPFFLRSDERAPWQDQIEAEAAWLAKTLGPEFATARPAPPDAPLRWGDDQARHLPGLLARLPRHLRVAAASYFQGQDDLPDALAALPARHRMGGNWWLRYKQGGPGAAMLERVYRKLRGQW